MQIEKNCLMCGESLKIEAIWFVTYYEPKKKYCSNKCKQKAYRERKKREMLSHQTVLVMKKNKPKKSE